MWENFVFSACKKLLQMYSRCRSRGDSSTFFRWQNTDFQRLLFTVTAARLPPPLLKDFGCASAQWINISISSSTFTIQSVISIKPKQICRQSLNIVYEHSGYENYNSSHLNPFSPEMETLNSSYLNPTFSIHYIWSSLFYHEKK